MKRQPVCVPRYLPPLRQEEALRRAIELNPLNAQHRVVVRTPQGRRGGPRRIALLIANRWPVSGIKLTVRFLDTPPQDLRKRILLHMNAWSRTGNVRFTETRGDALVRIARLDSPEDVAGYWSYVGTQILGVRKDEPTLNLEGFTMKTPENEFRRVVRHEAGHTLGFEHEHMRSGIVKDINHKAAFAYFDRFYGWTKQEVREQVLTPLKDASLMGTTETDPISIMCYQLPGAIMKSGKAVPGGKDINATDFRFAGTVYPRKVKAPSTVR